MRRLAGMLVGTIVVASLVWSGAASARTPVTSVVGGTPASITRFPFMARIRATEGGYEYTCSGTVVAPNMILTAAHCLLNESKTAFLNPSGFEVLTGTDDFYVPGVVSTAERLVIDPSYQPTGPLAGWHDAGLIQLTAPIAAPAVTLETSEAWGAGTPGYIVGWGLTEEGMLPSEMQAGETVVQSPSYCQGAVGPEFHPLAELCSIDYPSYESATCNGDSGGPLLMVSNHELVEIGITSFGIEEGCPTDSPRVDTRVDVESAWVEREIAAHPPEPVPAPPPEPAPVPTPAPPAPQPSAPSPSSSGSPSVPAPTQPPASPEPPRLTATMARHDVFRVLRTDRHLAWHFRAHRRYRSSCRVTHAAHAQCNAGWLVGALRYWGIVTISEAWEGSTPVWGYHYWIHRSNRRCRARLSHRRRCRNLLFHA